MELITGNLTNRCWMISVTSPRIRGCSVFFFSPWSREISRATLPALGNRKPVLWPLMTARQTERFTIELDEHTQSASWKHEMSFIPLWWKQVSIQRRGNVTPSFLWVHYLRHSQWSRFQYDPLPVLILNQDQCFMVKCIPVRFDSVAWRCSDGCCWHLNSTPNQILLCRQIHGCELPGQQTQHPKHNSVKTREHLLFIPLLKKFSPFV